MEAWEQIPLDAEAGARKLVAEYGDRLFRAAVLLCRDEHLAEDLVFRTFERVVDRIGQYDPRLPFWNWLYTILLNFFRMDMRKRKAFVVEDAELAEESLDSPDEGISDRMSQLDAATIRKAVERLSPPFRETVVLRYFEDKTLQEMANLMAVPVGTVKWRLHQARSDLERMLSRLFKEKEV
jgi:RNA polymerase sigma-70 factor (ECF subfamily)